MKPFHGRNSRDESFIDGTVHDPGNLLNFTPRKPRTAVAFTKHPVKVRQDSVNENSPFPRVEFINHRTFSLQTKYV